MQHASRTKATCVALCTARAVKIFDVAKDTFSPLYFFSLSNVRKRRG